MYIKTCLWFMILLISEIALAACPTAPSPFEPYDVGKFELAIDGNVIASCGAYSVLLDPKTYQGDMTEDFFNPLSESILSELRGSVEQFAPLFLDVGEISGPVPFEDISAFKVFGPDGGYVIALGFHADRLYDLIRIVSVFFQIPKPAETVYTPPVAIPRNESPRRVVPNQSSNQETPEEWVGFLDEALSSVPETDGSISDVSFHEIDGQAPLELVVDTWSGGNHCCFTKYIYALGPPITTAYAKETLGYFEDLNNDGKEELIHQGIVYIGDLPMCCYPIYNSVEGWDGEGFVEQTGLYPILAERNMEQNRTDFLNASSEGDVTNLNSAALGYYANAVIIGQGQQAWEWLEQNASNDVLAWLLPLRTDVDQRFEKYNSN